MIEKDWKYKFTVFTPCYKSEKLITRLFESLQEQTFTDFEWVVIDDNSPDDTVKVLENLIPTANFPVNFIKNETNQMVNKNYEIALEAAQGEFFTKLSHDDYLLPDALKNYYDTWNEIPEEKRENLAGVTLHCALKEGTQEGTDYPKSPWIADDYEMRFKYKVQGEKCSAQKTDKMREFPFYHPDIDTYVPADLHFYWMNHKYKSVYGNKMARVHVIDEDLHVYLENQIGRGKKYTKGISYWYENMINDLHWKVWQYSKKNHIINLINFIRYARYNGDSYQSIFKRIKHKRFLIPIGVLGGNLNELIKFKTLL